ncbi:hypothetical protein CKO35_04735 [Ectothiorhodospira shaposhnikovii]|uniref:hypothetical protein n=1 Tax=Ectothiorhodospira shaposhnikovii TaxID=1054 RepID=UPI001A927580|nr:hypothetical protein [Ectothiorhodospira shaposhnikovii]MBK1672614.1 hypothetical protein [Ectothiorhodospira shaposhnikovii]
MFKPLVVLMVLFVATGCAGWQPAPEQSAEERVAQRAQERRDALLAGDLEKAYSYLTPGYRANNSLPRYRARFGGAVSWKDASVRSVTCQEEDACTVTVMLTYRVAMPRMDAYENQRPMEERWVRVDGDWWHLPRR